MATRGRPTDFTPQTRRTILRALQLGATREMACKAAGITPETLRVWLLRGTREKRTDFSAFSGDVSRAEGARAVKWLTFIEKNALADWRAAAWLLERIYPEVYSKAATEVPVLLEKILAKLPQDVALQVLQAAGVTGEASETEVTP